MGLEHDEYSLPPGCKCSILAHPSGSNESVEVALFQDHRYAFFFWSRWTRQLDLEDRPPALISLDWHEDLVWPEGPELDELTNLDQGDVRELSLFCWESLIPSNDGHILAAAYLNLVGDIYIVRKQSKSEEEFGFMDVKGGEHRVRCFDTIDELMDKLKGASVDRIFLDIDLDYFTESGDSCGGGQDVEMVADEVVKGILNPKGEFFRWAFERFAGMTVATEPEYCGGIVSSNHLLSLLSECLFHPQLLADDAAWKHFQT